MPEQFVTCERDGDVAPAATAHSEEGRDGAA
jgi:hypothetical protein